MTDQAPGPPSGAPPREITDIKWFAGLAMQSIIAVHGVPTTDAAREEIALWSYRMGQAMIQAENRLHVANSS